MHADIKSDDARRSEPERPEKLYGYLRKRVHRIHLDSRLRANVRSFPSALPLATDPSQPIKLVYPFTTRYASSSLSPFLFLPPDPSPSRYTIPFFNSDILYFSEKIPEILVPGCNKGKSKYP